MIEIKLEAVAAFVMLGKVVSSELQIANQSVPKDWGGKERLDVEETT